MSNFLNGVILILNSNCSFRNPLFWGALCTRAECVWTWCTLANQCISPTTWPTWGMRSKCFSSTVEERTCVCTRASSMREVSVPICSCVCSYMSVCAQGDKPQEGTCSDTSHTLGGFFATGRQIWLTVFEKRPTSHPNLYSFLQRLSSSFQGDTEVSPSVWRFTWMGCRWSGWAPAVSLNTGMAPDLVASTDTLASPA